MAGLAVPILEGAGLALARALGYTAAATAGAAAVNEAAKRKTEEAEKAKASPIAQAGTQTKTKEACKQCPPDCGTLVPRNWAMSEESRAYQARISGFAPYTEWSFGGADFDGFKSSQCLLLEAKARYDQFFDEVTGEPEGFFSLFGVKKIILQAKKHNRIVQANPPAFCSWHFMQPLSCAYFSARFRVPYPFVRVHHTP